MLREFVEKNHYIFVDKIDTWEESIRIGCKPIEADGTVDPRYAEQIIECVKKYGPYIIIIPNVAMPHSQEGAEGVNKTAISFMKVKEAVHFEEGNPEKDANLFFTLASCNPDEHMANMVKLSEMLMNEELVEELLKAEGPEDLLRLQEKYLD
ncbi:PTS sugar transporter subunit IIA [Anaerobium acetethylicum]|uniref:Ascorbate-specific PTS system EIIA component n=1 Tax=Anaerobium acetethylicum TaxID=1619234 RepID=A0A1D3TRX4_9FIRM|nr:PTS sugar transporter subunit IIA [Anaerobium acetethylicum]SCP96536.1 PTS system, ascorbate-specific IIA component [Anaerobium acetethylicum]